MTKKVPLDTVICDHIIDSRTLRQQIYEDLKKLIIQGSLAPGEVISLRKLAVDYGVSFMPVREAVWQLNSEGILTVECNKRIVVSRLTPSQLKDILEVRLLLETEAVKKACARADKERVKFVQQSYDRMIEVIDYPDQYTPANMNFHFTLYEGAKSPALLAMIHKLWARVGPYFSIHAAEPEIIKHAQKNHYKIVQAYSAFNAADVTEALKRDLTDTADYLLPFLEKEINGE